MDVPPCPARFGSPDGLERPLRLMSVKPAFQKTLTHLHTWFGLSAGLVIAFLGLTAAGFVLRPHLDGLVYGRQLIGWTVGSPMEIPAPPESRYRPGEKRVPLQRLWERCQQVYPGASWTTNR
jgi:hypothetical protein